MITDWQVQQRGEAIILGIAVGCAHLDVVTTRDLIFSCVKMLESPHDGLVDTRMGQFGELPISLNLHHDDSVSIFIDGPDFDAGRCQSAAIWVEKDRLAAILKQVING